MADRIVRAISTDGMVQAAAICSRDLTERARQIHKTLPVATAALGRALAAASMMGNALKSDDASLTLQFKGGGPLGTVLAVSDNEEKIKKKIITPEILYAMDKAIISILIKMDLEDACNGTTWEYEGNIQGKTRFWYYCDEVSKWILHKGSVQKKKSKLLFTTT